MTSTAPEPGPRGLRTDRNHSEGATGVSFATISIVGGYIITHFGYAPLFLSGGAFSLIGTALFWAYFGGKHKEKGEST